MRLICFFQKKKVNELTLCKKECITSASEALNTTSDEDEDDEDEDECDIDSKGCTNTVVQ